MSHKRVNRSNVGLGNIGPGVPANNQMVAATTGGVHRKNKQSHYIVNTNKLMEFNNNNQGVVM